MAIKRVIALILVAVIVIGVIGAVVWQQFHPQEQTTSGPITVVDDVGRKVTITNYPPERIVSLAPSCTEILFALDLGDQVVGVDEYSDYPPEVVERVNAGNLTTVGSYAEISIETVVGLQPDLILATGGVQQVVAESLAELGQTVLVLYPEAEGFDGVLDTILMVGKATGQVEEGEALVTDMQKSAQEIINKTQGAPTPRVYVEYFFNGGFWSFAGESYTSELISMAGGVNVFAGFSGGHISVSTEEVLKADPEIIIISKGAMAEDCGLTPETIRNRPGWNEISAVKNDRIYEIEEKPLVIGGPRLIEGLEELAKIIHPELFGEK